MEKENQVIWDLLIVGGGPTGLTAAAEANRLGLTVRIVDRKKERGGEVDSRAIVIHPRVMELLKPLGNGSVIEQIKRVCFEIKNINFILGPTSKDKVQVPFAQADLGDTEFKPTSWLPQYITESILEKHLKDCRIHVEWLTTICSLSQNNAFVDTTVTKIIDGQESERKELIRSRFVIGCDGGRSKTRELVGIEMKRNKSRMFLAAAELKFDETCLIPGNELTIFLNHNGTCANFPLNEKNRFRSFMVIPDASEVPEVTDDLLRSRFISVTKLEPNFQILHKTSFNIAHGVVNTFRSNRVFVAGDAAHVHSPLGGQGMNYGIQDSINLVWKVAWVRRMQESMSIMDISDTMSKILDSYDVERRSLAHKLIDRTSLGTDIVLSNNTIVQWFRSYMIRNWISYLMVENGGAYALAQLTTEYNPKNSYLLDCTSSSKNYIAVSGARLPNLHLADGSRLYDHVDRKHFTIVILNGNEKHAEKTINTCKIVCVSAADTQEKMPKIDANAYKAAQVLLVRPDLHVFCVASTLDHVRHKFFGLLPAEAVSCM